MNISLVLRIIADVMFFIGFLWTPKDPADRPKIIERLLSGGLALWVLAGILRAMHLVVK